VSVERLLWEGKEWRPAVDASGELDFGRIDSFEWEEARYVLTGDRGSIEASRPARSNSRRRPRRDFGCLGQRSGMPLNQALESGSSLNYPGDSFLFARAVTSSNPPFC